MTPEENDASERAREAHAPAARTVAELIYSLLLRAFPRELRERYGSEMLQLYRDRRREVDRQPPGVSRRCRRIILALLAFLDIMVEGANARFASSSVRALPSRRRGRRPLPERRRNTMDSVLQDVRYATRSLARAPGFVLVVVATLAVGMGAVTALFSVVSGVLLRPLPYPQPDRVVRLMVSFPDGDNFPWLSYPNLVDLRDASVSFDAVAASRPGSIALIGAGEAVELSTGAVTPGFFDIFGLPPATGRFFTREEHTAGGHPVTVISYGLWRRQFGADPGVVGTPISLGGRPHVVVGVAAPASAEPIPGLGGPDLWTPARFEGTGDADRPYRGSFGWEAFGRLTPNTTVEVANAELAALSTRLNEQFPRENEGATHHVRPLHEETVADARGSLQLLLAAVVLLLAIAVANVANLFLARASDRGPEMAVRAALGAGRARILRQLLTESAILAGLGALCGLGVALVLRDGLLALGAGAVPMSARSALDLRVLMFTVAVTIVTAFALGLAPAIQASTSASAGALSRATRGSTGTIARARVRSALVIGEVALAFLLLMGASLLARSFWLLSRIEPGFDPAIITFRVVPSQDKHPDEESLVALYEALRERIRSVPGVAGVALTTAPPMTGQSTCGTLLALDQPEPAPEETPCAEVRPVTPGYFETMGIDLHRGRLIDANDIEGAPLVVVISESTGRTLWPGENPLGRRLVTGWNRPREVIGIVRDVKLFRLDESPVPQTYVPLAQQPRRGVNAVVDVPGGLASVARALRDAVHDVDPDLPATGLQTMADHVERRLARERFRTTLLAAFAAVAALLATLGIYGVVSYSVVHRRSELAIRMALGARPDRLLAQVVGRGMATVSIGLVLGLAASRAVGQLLAAFLYQVTPTDPWSLVVVLLGLTGVALVATALPAWRATKVAPVEAMRRTDGA